MRTAFTVTSRSEHVHATVMNNHSWHAHAAVWTTFSTLLRHSTPTCQPHQAPRCLSNASQEDAPSVGKENAAPDDCAASDGEASENPLRATQRQAKSSKKTSGTRKSAPRRSRKALKDCDDSDEVRRCHAAPRSLQALALHGAKHTLQHEISECWAVAGMCEHWCREQGLLALCRTVVCYVSRSFCPPWHGLMPAPATTEPVVALVSANLDIDLN